MSALATRSFWASAAERAVKTTAQALIGAIGAAATFDSVSWDVAGGTAALATLLSLLSSIVSAPVGPDDSPSLV